MGRRGLPGILVLSALLWTACGLPEPFYLNPPTAAFNNDPTTGSFTIQMTDHSSEPEFRGYELYYKFYADATAASAEAASLGGPTKTVDDLLQHGFLTLCRGPGTGAGELPLPQDSSVETRATPFLAINVNDRSPVVAFPITVTFNPEGATEISTNFSYTSPTYGPTSQEIDRHVDASTGRCKPFTFGAGNYVQTDADFSAVYGSIQGQLLYVAVYAVSYGLQDLSTPIFSYPVALGYLQFQQFSS
jgi:hypothetical protein